MDQDVTCLFNQSKMTCLTRSRSKSINSLCRPSLNFYKTANNCNVLVCSYIYTGTDSAIRTSLKCEPLPQVGQKVNWFELTL